MPGCGLRILPTYDKVFLSVYFRKFKLSYILHPVYENLTYHAHQ